MRRIRVWIIGFFGFSRSETNAFLILLPLMALLLFSAPVFRWWWGTRPVEVNDKLLDSLVASWQWNKPARDNLLRKLPSPFPFDPNTASLDDLKNLGFPEKLAQRLLNYRTKGGKFKVKRDLSKLYGMDSSLVNRLYNYINLPERITFAKTLAPVPITSPVRSTRFDLNLADSTRLIQIYGIGPKLSLRIIKYRDRLGGFVSTDQLGEVYGLDSAVLSALKNRAFIADDFRPHQINVNEADEKRLSSLPYIKFHLAKSIAAYRFQHGAFASIEQLQQLALMDESLFQKIKPYLTVKD